MRVVGREPERLVDSRLELLGEHVLEPVGLGVDLVDVNPQCLSQVQLQQAVVPRDLERDTLSFRRQRHALVGRVNDEREGGELLDHRARRRRGDAHSASESGRRDGVARRTELVDLPQVVLDGDREQLRPWHGSSVGEVVATATPAAWHLPRGARGPARRREPVEAGSCLGPPAGSATVGALVDVRVGHSPDPDDAFMYWALTTDLVATRGFRFEQVLADIQTLNHWARAARLEVTAISLAAYPFVQQDYALLPHGASIGSGYGPVVVARDPLSLDDLQGVEIVVPGALTTAYLVLRLALGDVAVRELPFELIPDEVASGRAEAGLLIHEGQLTFSELGLAKVLDLGEWWLLETGLPLPLGVNVARRDVERLHDLSAVLRDAILCGLEHREEALEYALRFGRGIDAAVADRFVAMYVNELTQDYGDEGRSAVTELLRRGDEIGAFPGPVTVDWV